MRIVGIDPGTSRVGYALLEIIGRTTELLRVETIIVPRRAVAAERLALLERTLEERLRRDRPDTVAVETLYFDKNAKTAMAVAEARGVILLTAYRLIRSIGEYTPLEVKVAVTGYGRADKRHVQRMVRVLLPHAHIPSSDDAADAIAVALAAAYTRRPVRSA